MATDTDLGLAVAELNRARTALKRTLTEGSAERAVARARARLAAAEASVKAAQAARQQQLE